MSRRLAHFGRATWPAAPARASGLRSWELAPAGRAAGVSVSAAAAVTLFFVEGGKSSPERSAGLQAGISPAGAFVRGIF
jgi:hypothetical protein